MSALPGTTEKSAPSVTCSWSALSHRHDAAVPSSDTVALVNTEAQSEGVEGSAARDNVTVIDLAVSSKVAFQANGGCKVGTAVGLAEGAVVAGANVAGAAVVGLDVVGETVLGPYV